jgi:predicted aldo/keto reductase-like oxidoreductase
MRLPLIEKGYEHLPAMERPVNIDEAERLLVYAAENGINYFDSAYVYHGGKSEVILGGAIKPYRNKVYIATKLPVMIVKKRSDVERFIDEQLKRLDTNYIDFYLLHGLGRHSWSLMKEYKTLAFLDRLKSDGRIRHAGFSFHDDVKTFKEIVDSYDWTMCQIQYNYYDENRQAGKEGLQYAAGKGIGVVIMEPLRGGRLTDNIPSSIQSIWDSSAKKRSPAEWALRWIYNHPEVSLALSGMNSMAQLRENIKTAEDALPGSMGGDEIGLINEVKKRYQEMLQVNCTGCGYCMPCPNGVNIPTNFDAFNNYYLFGDKTFPKIEYNVFMPEDQRASACVECGECEEKCPQQIAIRDELKRVHDALYMKDMPGPK